MTEPNMPALVIESPAPLRRSLWGYWALLMTFLVMLAASGLAVQNMKRQLKNDIKALETRVAQAEIAADGRAQALDEDVSNAKRRIDNNLDNHQGRLSDIETRLQDHQIRLQSLTNRTLDDRLLAETLLLLKQANQQLLLERDQSGAQLLLTEAEQLLNHSFASSDDSQFLAVRQSLNRDLTALRMLKPLDKQGIYLQLSALIELIPQLAMQPSFAPVTEPAAAEQIVELDNNSSWRDWVAQGFRQFKAGIKNYIRLDDRADLTKPILTQEAAKLVQFNLRLLLEQAQIALLEQQNVIYQHSVVAADKLVADYFWGAEGLDQYRQNLGQLTQLEVAPVLPSLSDSLGLLMSYIEHKQQLSASDPHPAGLPPVPSAPGRPVERPSVDPHDPVTVP